MTHKITYTLDGQTREKVVESDSYQFSDLADFTDFYKDGEDDSVYTISNSHLFSIERLQ